MPHSTRKRAARSLQMLRNKRRENPWKKHDDIPILSAAWLPRPASLFWDGSPSQSFRRKPESSAPKAQ
jgi:hypothetical protein